MNPLNSVAGIEFDAEKGTGAVLHMLSGLPIDGRFGMTAIGRSRQEADEVYEAAVVARYGEARTPPRRREMTNSASSPATLRR